MTHTSNAIENMEAMVEIEAKLGRADCCILCNREIPSSMQVEHSDVCQNCATKEFNAKLYQE